MSNKSLQFKAKWSMVKGVGIINNIYEHQAKLGHLNQCNQMMALLFFSFTLGD